MTEATITETPTDKLRTAAQIDIEHEFDQLVRQRRLARIDRGDQA
ncbi:MAG: hypothetical protein ACLPQY_17370 [Streptosporangiaceae bacterium]